MQKKKKKKHMDDFTGKTVSWPFRGRTLQGVVLSQELLLKVEQPGEGGRTESINAKSVTVVS